MPESTKSPAEVLVADEWSELEQLAEAATGDTTMGDLLIYGGAQATVAVRDFVSEANPATVLALLAENAALRSELAELREHRITADLLVSTLKADKTEAERKLAEAVGLLREWMGTWFVDADSRGENAIADDTRKFLSKEAERG